MKLKGQGRWGNVKGCRQAPSVYFQGYGEAQGFCGEVRALVGDLGGLDDSPSTPRTGEFVSGCWPCGGGRLSPQARGLPGLSCLTPHPPSSPTDSIRSFLKRNKLGRFSEEERAQQEAENSKRLIEEEAQASTIPVGSRCEVRAPGQPPRRGTVMYVGTWPTEASCPALQWAVLGT